MVIDQIQKDHEEQQNPLPLAFFYCTRESSEPRRANPTEIMLSILKQLSCKDDDTPILLPVTAKWKQRLSQGFDNRLDLQECIDLIIELAKNRGAVIVIDALDEAQKDTRQGLLEGLDRITKESDHLIKIFVSSRRDQDIKQHFDNTPRVEIAARENSEDIEKFISTELDKKIASKRLLKGEPSPDLVAEIKAVLTERADGM